MELRNPENIQIGNKSLAQILILHVKWLHGSTKGERANLIGADLAAANLMRANLEGANLKRVNFSHANLVSADLTNVNLAKAKLLSANISDAKLVHAHLTNADLAAVNLSNTNLRQARLLHAKLPLANLAGADLTGAYLKNANLSGANLSNCILTHADCRVANFMNALLTGAVLYGTATFGWKIKGIQCDYIYLDVHRENRYPNDRNFERGEFERLYQSIPTVEFIFKQGMKWVDALVLDWIAAKSREEKPELGLELLSIDRRGTYPSASLRVS